MHLPKLGLPLLGIAASLVSVVYSAPTDLQSSQSPGFLQRRSIPSDISSWNVWEDHQAWVKKNTPLPKQPTEDSGSDGYCDEKSSNPQCQYIYTNDCGQNEIRKIQLLDVIASGYGGDIWHGIQTVNDGDEHPVQIEIVKSDPIRRIESFQLLKEIDSSNVLKLDGYFYSSGKQYKKGAGRGSRIAGLVSEWGSTHTIADFKSASQAKKNEAFAEAASGLRAINAAGIIHGNITLENIMWSSGKAKIAGFDVAAKPLTSSGLVNYWIATAGSSAPEPVKQKPYKKSIDLFGLAFAWIRLSFYEDLKDDDKRYDLWKALVGDKDKYLTPDDVENVLKEKISSIGDKKEMLQLAGKALCGPDDRTMNNLAFANALKKLPT